MPFRMSLSYRRGLAIVRLSGVKKGHLSNEMGVMRKWEI